MKRILLLLVLLLILPCYAQDIRSKVRTDVPGAQFTDSIDPETGIFGIPYGTTEDEFIAKFGMPVGYIRLSPGNTAMLYGKSHAFLFSGNKLVGVRITDIVLDWKLSLDITGQTPCDDRGTPRWRLTNGIRNGMNLAEVRDILGQSLSEEDKYNVHYDTKTSRVELDFGHYSDQGDNDKAYKLHALLVRKR